MIFLRHRLRKWEFILIYYKQRTPNAEATAKAHRHHSLNYYCEFPYQFVDRGFWKELLISKIFKMYKA